jgi:hypothetical protein
LNGANNVSFNFDALPHFTVSRIEIINRLTQRLHKINHPESPIIPLYVPREKVKAPSTLATFGGHVVTGVARIGLKLPERLMSYTAVKCCGNFDNFSSLAKAKAGWRAYFYVGHDRFVAARLLDVNHRDASGAIVVNDPSSRDLFKIGSAFPFLDGYWGERSHLVYDTSRDWQRVQFVPYDSAFYHNDGRAEVIEGGWDHEHCAICWQTISPSEPDNEYGYRDQDDTWVCQTCYEQYVVPKCLDFIILDQIFY